LQIAIGIPKRRDGAAADMLLIADRLPRLIIDEVDFRQLDQYWHAVTHGT
jgi:hypothetical protein